MFLINLNAEIVAYILSFRKSRHKPNLENTSKYGFSPDLGGKNGGVLSMRMQVILDSSFARPGSAPIWGGKKGEFRDWTTGPVNQDRPLPPPSRPLSSRSRSATKDYNQDKYFKVFQEITFISI